MICGYIIFRIIQRVVYCVGFGFQGFKVSARWAVVECHFFLFFGDDFSWMVRVWGPGLNVSGQGSGSEFQRFDS